MQANAKEYPWIDELEKTVVNSLTTTFGLDFLLFEDKAGGDVDTIHNVRQGIWATEEEKQRYENRGPYDSTAYHTDPNFIKTGREDKQRHQAGELHDTYRNKTMGRNEERNLDHIISAKEVDDDSGRGLAEIDGVKLANQDSNLQSTHETINKSKKQAPTDAFLSKLPNIITAREEALDKARKQLDRMPRDTTEQQHKARKQEEAIRKDEERIKVLKSIDPARMREKDKAARARYNQQINGKYYTSSKFLTQTAKASAQAGLKMGARQMLGMVLAEIWFELREQVPRILARLKDSFDLEIFLQHIRDSLKGIWHRVKRRFKDFLIAFRDGVFAGIMSSLTTTLFNIFATTQKLAIKIIRELWSHLVKAIKLMVFNPDQLAFPDLCKAVAAVLSVGVAALVGTMIYAQLLPLCDFPFGGELVTFASALVTGIVTLGLNYVVLHSELAHKLWAFVESIMPHADTIKRFQAINAELDRYLIELGRIEFNLDADELTAFSQQLTDCNDEIQRSLLLKEEVAKRGITLPYQIGDPASTRQWLSSLAR